MTLLIHLAAAWCLSSIPLGLLMGRYIKHSRVFVK